MQPDHRFLSRPMRLHWAGWETDTYRLQQAGWQMSAEQDVWRDVMRIALRHPQLGAEGISEVTAFQFHQQVHDHGPVQAVARMHMGREVRIEGMGTPNFSAIDAMPQFTERRITSLEDLAHFAPQLTRTEQILVPEESVDELLSRILERQQAAKTAHFRDMVAREGHVLPPHRFAAQIISFREAA